jgi:ABC-type hemin transport system substrate-binding protein
MKLHLPERIICMTEETTEWLYLLGQSARIVGISGYTVRPKIARTEKPRISAFTSAKIDKILALEPDCVFGFSDLQADIAATLIRHGVQVTIFNQRSVDEIFTMLYQVAAMVGKLSRVCNAYKRCNFICKPSKLQPHLCRVVLVSISKNGMSRQSVRYVGSQN